ncbi:hypothetical protein NP493_143g01026 [Ridgeia piscesae]|uniref:Cilia- and flagella-associated protein 74 n=1 Tax=Ridgeia piscesae TaxID=27915 RepID=A0AAD9P4R3_RIDPI|nr:hypothetical protein NP493_143g01026 [Ridgeia piscesae]
MEVEEDKCSSIQEEFPEDSEAEEILYLSDIKDYDTIDSSSDLEFSDSEADVEVQDSAPEERILWKDQVRMIHLRRYLDALTKNLEDRNYHLQEARSELQNCRERLVQLKQEATAVQGDIEKAINENNVPSSRRLTSQHERIRKELHNEEKLEALIKLNVETAEYEVAKAEVEMGKYQLVEDDLWRREEVFQHQQTSIADLRHRREVRYKNMAQKMHKSAQLSHQNAEAERKVREKEMIEKARRSHDRARRFVQGTINKMRRRVEAEEEQDRAFKQKRMDMLINLKGSITANRENLRAMQARDKALEKRRSQLELRREQQILSAEGNASEIMMRDNLLKAHAQKAAAHKAADTDRRVEIVERLLIEEERMKKRKEAYPYLFTDASTDKAKMVKPRKRKPVKLLDDMIAKDEEADRPVELDASKFEDNTQSDDEENRFSSFAQTAENTLMPSSDSDEETGTNLAKPEFDGLWDRHKPYKAPPDGTINLKPVGGSKMQKDIMQRGLQQQRDGIVTHQVAAGREFKGRPFYSKPDVIHFKDFDVGKTYRKKVLLTNVSYTVNYCKLTGITEHLKDFIETSFDPPGQMSAGLTCELQVTFKPMINEDLEGEVTFLAQTGPFSIPLICTTKKCDLSVSSQLIDFGVSVIGETLHKSVTLVNRGALGTKVEFYKISGVKRVNLTTAETSLGRVTTANTMGNVSPDSAPLDQETGDKDIMDKLVSPMKTVDDTKKDDEAQSSNTNQDAGVDGERERDGEKMEQLESIFSEEMEMPLNDMEDLLSIDGMKIGGERLMEIAPFSSVKLEVIWQPTVPGKVETEFIVAFTDPDSESITLQANADAIDVPVWVERQCIDLKTCMLDRLYQDTIIVNNRATTALRVKFEVCKQLRDHLELLPKTGYIQAQAQFSAQLKFLPRPSIFTEMSQFFDKETGVLEAPMIITVMDQVRPVSFTVHAVVTYTDLEFDVKNIDFGHCTIYESVKKTVRLTNKSILPQQYGFVGVPQFVDVQPGDGFGTLLPLETIELDIIFLPAKAKEYTFTLSCKSLINREFKIECKGVGVHPPLELSHQVVHLAATAMYDVTMTTVHVINSHTNMNEFSHPVPRIGTGPIAPVGPTSFEFNVPDGAPLTLAPSVGTVMPGKKQSVMVRFTPTLDDAVIRIEAAAVATRLEEQRLESEYKASLVSQEIAESQSLKRKTSGKGKAAGKAATKGAKSRTSGEITTPPPTTKPPPVVEPRDADSVIKGSDEYVAAQASLLRQYSNDFETFVIPCYVASGNCVNPGQLSYSEHDTLYLTVHCPRVKPELVVISDRGRTTTDFSDVSIGQSVLKSITIQNISMQHINLRASCLDTNGPFVMLNSLRHLAPNSSHTILINFTPHKTKDFQEVLKIHCPDSVLALTLKGKGVQPVVSLSIEDNLMDLGAVVVGEYREETFKINNMSPLAVQYSIKLDSVSLLRHARSQGVPEFLRHNDSLNKPHLVGVQNNNGQNVFDCVPVEGSIPAGGSQEVTVSFAPDHISDHFSDGVHIELFGEQESYSFQLLGQVKEHIMYLEGGEPLSPEVESLSVAPPAEVDEDPTKMHAPPPVLVNLESVAQENEFTVATRDIHVGCVRTMAVSQKKNGEWSFENVQALASLGFTIEPQKGMVEAGCKKAITITWTPPPDHNSSVAVETSVWCTLKGDIAEQVKVILRALIVSE